MSLLASPIHSFVHLFILFLFTLVVFIYTFVHLYIRFMFTLFVFFSLHLSIFTSFYVYTCCLILYAYVHLYIRFMCTFFVFFSPSICCPFEKMKSRSVDERSCPFLSKIKITQNMFLEQKNVLAKFRRMSLRWTRHTDD